MTRFMLSVLSLALLFSPPAAAEIAPLSSELRSALEAIRSDPRPKEIIKGTHYVTSNEPKQHLFKSQLNVPGGLYVGVGAEQNYHFIAWSRPEIAVLIDFDDVISRLHKVYATLFKRIDTPDELIACWNSDPKGKVASSCPHAKVLEWLAEDYQDDALKGVKNVWRYSKKRVGPHLKKLKAHYAELGVATFVNDQSAYTYIAHMVRAGRIHALRGDFTKRRTMHDIAAFAKKACLPVRTLYLSNVDDYLTYYNGQHRKNMLGLPGDERSMVVQTEPSGSTTYHYIVQPLSVYRAWLQCRCVYGISVVRPHRVPLGDTGLQTLKALPAEVDAYKKKANKFGPAPSFALPDACAAAP